MRQRLAFYVRFLADGGGGLPVGMRDVRGRKWLLRQDRSTIEGKWRRRAGRPGFQRPGEELRLGMKK